MQLSIVFKAHEISGPQMLIHQIQELILDKLSVKVDSPQTDLFQTGVFDSLTLIQFILHLEEHFGLHIPVGDLDFDSFVSIEKMAGMVEHHLATGRASSRSHSV